MHSSLIIMWIMKRELLLSQEIYGKMMADCV